MRLKERIRSFPKLIFVLICGQGANGIAHESSIADTISIAPLQFATSELQRDSRIEAGNMNLTPITALFSRSQELSNQSADIELISKTNRQTSFEKQGFRAVVLLNRTDELIKDKQVLEQLHGIVLKGVELPASKTSLESILFSANFSDAVDTQIVQKIREAIFQFYQDNHRPFILVEAPSQNLTSGVIQFVISESKLGEITIEGAGWSSTQRLLKYLKIQPGDPINSAELVNHLNFINRNPFRSADIIYGPGKKELTTDIELVIQEAPLFSVYAGTDNTGIKSIGQMRLFAGFNLASAFGLDHIFSAQYTASDDFHKFQAITLQYTIPFSWNQLLSLYGGYSRAHVDLSSPGMNNEANATQASLRYIIPLMPISTLNHQIDVGFDFKQMNNTVFFAEVFPVYNKVVNLTQLMLAYGLDKQSMFSSHQFRMQMFCSPGGFLPNQTSRDYNDLRPGAVNHWVYLNAFWQYIHKWSNGISLRLTSQGQWSSETLLPSEELGMGGYNTVRGYYERQYNADTGVLFSIEGRSPSHPLFFHKGKTKDQLQWIIFTDFGVGMDREAVPTQKKNGYLIGAGPGIRYSIGRYLSARLDWGIKLHHEEDFLGSDSLVHFGLIASY